MAIKLSKPALDVGIVTVRSEQMLAFYRDVLGFRPLEPLSFPGTTIHRLVVGESILRLVELDQPPPPATGGDLFSTTGLRYLTLLMDDLNEVVDACRAFGVAIARPPTETRPGVFATRVQDPDGNWIEMQSEKASP